MPIYNVQHDEDPKEKLYRKAGNLDHFEIYNRQILVGIYVRSEKSKSGLILTTRTRDEDKYQSKVGLILKAGPSAFDDPSGVWFTKGAPKVGDWVVFRASDGWAITLPIHCGPADDTDVDGKGFICRLMDDDAVRMRIPHPDCVY